MTLLDRNQTQFPSSAPPSADSDTRIRITAASEGRGDLAMLILAHGHWALFDARGANASWLGDIREIDGRYHVSHDDGSSAYSFAEFRQALSYFMEYAFALDFVDSAPSDDHRYPPLASG